MVQSQIRWSRSDYARLGRAVSDFNKKVREIETEENKLYLPDEQKYKDIKSQITTRSELNRVINSLRRFNREGAENIASNKVGQTMTAWEKGELNIQRNIAIRRLNKEIRELNKPTKNGYSRVQMGSLEANKFLAEIRSFKKLEQKLGYEFNRIKIRLEDLGRSDYNMVKATIFRENFMKALESSSNFDGYDLLIKKLNRLKNPLNFYNYIKQSNVFSDIFLYYKKGDGLTYGAFSNDQDRFNYGLEELRTC